jgi:hypothetical protein
MLVLQYMQITFNPINTYCTKSEIFSRMSLTLKCLENFVCIRDVLMSDFCCRGTLYRIVQPTIARDKQPVRGGVDRVHVHMHMHMLIIISASQRV